VSYSLITAMAQVPEQVLAQEPGLAREPEQVPGLAQVPEPALVLQGRAPACWLPGPQARRHARRCFCQRHNTQRRPG
jgi:hypothetical protein